MDAIQIDFRYDYDREMDHNGIFQVVGVRVQYLSANGVDLDSAGAYRLASSTSKTVTIQSKKIGAIEARFVKNAVPGTGSSVKVEFTDAQVSKIRSLSGKGR